MQNENIETHLRNITQEHKVDKDLEENKFCKKIARCKTKRYLQKLFDELMNYRNHIIIRSGDAWDMIIDKVYEIDGNADKILIIWKLVSFHTIYIILQIRHIFICH